MKNEKLLLGTARSKLLLLFTLLFITGVSALGQKNAKVTINVNDSDKKLGLAEIGPQQGYIEMGKTGTVSYEITIHRADDNGASGELNIGMCLKNAGENLIFNHPGFSFYFDPEVPVMEWGNNKQYEATTTLYLTVIDPTQLTTDPVQFAVRAFHPATTNNGCLITEGDFTDAPGGVFQPGIPPSFTTCPGDVSAGTDAGVCNALVNYTVAVDGNPAPTVSYEFTGATAGSGTGDGSGSTFEKGATTVMLTATNGIGDDATCSFTVTVADNEAPQLTDINTGCSTLDNIGLNWCLSDAESFDPETLENSVAALYQDNCPGVVTAEYSSTLPGTENRDCRWEMIYNFDISDIAGNTTTCSVKYTGGDQSAPALLADAELPAGETNMNLCFDNIPAGPSAEEIAGFFEDNCGAVNVEKSQVKRGNNCGWQVTYTYKIYDNCNRKADDVVIVYSGKDQDAPVMTDHRCFLTRRKRYEPVLRRNAGGTNRKTGCSIIYGRLQ